MLKRQRNRRGIAVVYVLTDVAGQPEVQIAKAIKTSSEYVATDGSGNLLEYRSTDWLIGAEDLVHGDPETRYTPEMNHQIKVTIEGVERVYDVLPMDGHSGRGHYRPSDPGESQFRIHSKQTE